jgi:hypothetical protein
LREQLEDVLQFLVGAMPQPVSLTRSSACFALLLREDDHHARRPWA